MVKLIFHLHHALIRTFGIKGYGFTNIVTMYICIFESGNQEDSSKIK